MKIYKYTDEKYAKQLMERYNNEIKKLLTNTDQYILQTQEFFNFSTRGKISAYEALYVINGLQLFEEQLSLGFDITDNDTAIFDSIIIQSLLNTYSGDKFREYFNIVRALDILEKLDVDVFLKWAVDNNFLIDKSYLIKNEVVDEVIAPTENKPLTYPKATKIYPDWFAKKLHQELTRQEFITGNFDKYWYWKISDTVKINAIAYLAGQLTKQFKLIVKNQSNLTAYIHYTGTAFNKVSATPSKTIQKKINSVIKSLSNEENNQN